MLPAQNRGLRPERPIVPRTYLKRKPCSFTNCSCAVFNPEVGQCIALDEDHPLGQMPDLVAR